MARYGHSAGLARVATLRGGRESISTHPAISADDFWPGERVSMQPGGLTLSPNEVLALLLEAAGEDVAKRGGCGREVTLGDMLVSL